MPGTIMIPLFLAQATNALSATNAALVTNVASATNAAPVTPEDVISHGVRATNTFLIYVAFAVGIYLLLLFLGRAIKRRLGVPLGWFYHMFCVAMGLFMPSLLPWFKDYDGVDQHIEASVVLTGAFVAISFVRHFLFERRTRTDSATMPKFISQLVSLVIVLAAGAIILRFIYHQDVSALLAGAGVAGLVLGLALQDTLGNLFSGLAIYFGGQFKSGDWLLIEGHHAQIVEVNWRSTRLRTVEDVYLDIPNKKITEGLVVNYDYPTSLHGLSLDIGLDYDAAPARVKSVLIESALACPFVLRDPPPEVYLKEFANFAVTYELTFWLSDHKIYKKAYSEIRTNLWYALRRHGISIPYPIQAEYSFEPPKSTLHDPDTAREALKKVIFYHCLTPEQIEHMARGAKVVTFGGGENIICQGADAGPMYILISGQAEVFVNVSGADTSVAKIGGGDCIGEISMLTGEARTATVRALKECLAVELAKETVSPIITSSPELLETLSDLLAKRRLQNEGLLAGASAAKASARQEDYRAGFLQKLKSFFEI